MRKVITPRAGIRHRVRYYCTRCLFLFYINQLYNVRVCDRGLKTPLKHRVPSSGVRLPHAYPHVHPWYTLPYTLGYTAHSMARPLGLRCGSAAEPQNDALAMLFSLILISHEPIEKRTVKSVVIYDAVIRFRSYPSVLTNKEETFVVFH